MCDNQQATLNAPDQHTIHEESVAYEKWRRLADLEEGYLRQKSKLHRLEVGDRNNAYFHRSTKIRRMHNSICEVLGPNNELFTSAEDIKT